jgi:hypothetical protein
MREIVKLKVEKQREKQHKMAVRHKPELVNAL